MGSSRLIRDCDSKCAKQSKPYHIVSDLLYKRMWKLSLGDGHTENGRHVLQARLWAPRSPTTLNVIPRISIHEPQAFLCQRLAKFSIWEVRLQLSQHVHWALPGHEISYSRNWCLKYHLSHLEATLSQHGWMSRRQWLAWRHLQIWIMSSAWRICRTSKLSRSI